MKKLIALLLSLVLALSLVACDSTENTDDGENNFPSSDAGSTDKNNNGSNTDNAGGTTVPDNNPGGSTDDNSGNDNTQGSGSGLPSVGENDMPFVPAK